jgi:hypothetical protein
VDLRGIHTTGPGSRAAVDRQARRRLLWQWEAGAAGRTLAEPDGRPDHDADAPAK